MWFIYGLIAISSPIGLLLARSWVMRGSLSTKAAAGVPAGPQTAAQSGTPPAVAGAPAADAG